MTKASKPHKMSPSCAPHCDPTNLRRLQINCHSACTFRQTQAHKLFTAIYSDITLLNRFTNNSY